MIETKFSIAQYLSEYLSGKYNNGASGAFRIPDNTDLYHTLWTLMAKRQRNQSPIDEGNVSIILPDRRLGKDPKVYNYISPRSAKLIEKSVKYMFDNELHIVMNENHLKGHLLDNRDVVYRFLRSYGIESISDDALLKNFYRYRDAIRKREMRRDYKKKLKHTEKTTDRTTRFVHQNG